MAVIARLDVVFAVVQLARFLTNLSDQYHTTVNQTIRYLFTTRYYTIQFNRAFKEALVIASDTSFVDDPDIQYSSQGYIMLLFGGLVVQKAGLQATVTTSITEAELLGVEQTVKESYALLQFMCNISLDLGQSLKIYCNNLQSIRLVHDSQRISTRLYYIDIQNIQLKQEFKKGIFRLEYLSISEILVDGLTKALTRQKFEGFKAILNIVDITDCIKPADSTD